MIDHGPPYSLMPYRRDNGPPYYLVPMPLNENGSGPEMDPLKAVSVLYQIWDCACCTVFESESEEAAREYLRTCEPSQEDAGLDARTE